MCQECGCGLGGEVKHHGSHKHAHVHPHDHDHDHGPRHEPDRNPARAGAGNDLSRPSESRVLSVQRSLLERNERLAEQNRGFFRARDLFVLNVLSAPGSGKTTLVQETARLLRGRLRTGVIVGDLATDNDAARLRAAGLPVVQITTGTLCHLEADMIARALDELDLNALDLLIIENVGNLVCPASYDLGEALRVVLLSVTEGEDKPLKYPPLFHSADVALITKSDLSVAVDFKRDVALANLRRISHHAQVFEVSARTGDGLEAWCAHLVACREGQLKSGGQCEKQEHARHFHEPHKFEARENSP